MDGTVLRTWREENGVGVRELARLLEVPPSTIVRWESGEIAISQPRILELALWALAHQRESSGCSSSA